MVEQTEQEFLNNVMNSVEVMIYFFDPDADVKFVETNDKIYTMIKTNSYNLYYRILETLLKNSNTKKFYVACEDDIFLNFGFIKDEKWVTVNSKDRFNIVLAENKKVSEDYINKVKTSKEELEKLFGLLKDPND